MKKTYQNTIKHITSTNLEKIVKTKDKEALEKFCLNRTYQQVINYARDINIDLEELEDLLAQI